MRSRYIWLALQVMFPVSLLVIGQSDVLFALYNKNVFGPWYDYNAVHNIKNWCMWIGGLWIVIILGLDLLTTKAAYD